MSKQESFEKEISILRELGSDTFVLRGSTLLVEIQEMEEIRTKGGIVLATHSDHAKGNSVAAHKVEVGVVLMAGEGYWNDDTGKLEPLDCQPGAVVMLPQYSTQAMSHFPGISRPTGNKLALVKMDQVLAYYPSKEAYELAKSKLND